MDNPFSGLDFGKQVGPLPLGAWIAVVGGGLGIAYYSSRNSGVDDTPIYVNDTSVTPGVGMGGVGAYTSTDGGSSPVTSATITSNTQWGSAAFQFLVAMGTDGAVADKAVRDYLSGLPLTLQYNALISLALAKLGQPPESLPDAPVLPEAPPPVVAAPPPPPPAPVWVPPSPPPPPPPPAARTYTVQPGDSLSRIAARYWEPWITWQSLYNLNRHIIGGNPNRIYAGQVLTIG